MALNRLEKGVARAATLLKSKFGIEVTFSTGAVTEVITLAKAGVRLANQEAAQDVDQDWLGTPADLDVISVGFLPFPGCTIALEDGTVYEVRRPNDQEDCYRIDQTSQLIRIHTKLR